MVSRASNVASLVSILRTDGHNVAEIQRKTALASTIGLAGLRGFRSFARSRDFQPTMWWAESG